MKEIRTKHMGFTAQLFLFLAVFSYEVRAQNPIIQTYYTADPAPMVYGDRVYMYTTHDQDTASTFFRMYDWRAYSTDDMVNWTDHGKIFSLDDISWGNDRAWAAQTVARNDKFYLYFCALNEQKNKMSVGVAVSDKPEGPFKDALGTSLVDADWGDIDPTVLIDDDGDAYMYWGNPKLHYVKLNEDMISYDKEVGVVEVAVTPEAFGPGGKRNPERGGYVEGPWLHKRKDLYYLLYPAGGIPEHLAYSTSKSPVGPWKYQDTIMPVIQEGGAFTNHPGLVEFKGQPYLFYHNGDLPGGQGFRRSVCAVDFEFNADGSIPLMEHSREGITKAVKNLNPYQRVEAETIAWSEGAKTDQNDEVGVFVNQIHDGDYIKVRAVDFGEKSPKKFFAHLAGGVAGSTIEIRLDGVDQQLIGTLVVPASGNREVYKEISTKIDGAKGVHDLYLVFKGTAKEELFNFDSWYFK
ncbi:glycoside hydrolase family 43 protein [Leeuwenhoekiella polynyae]|uniref:Carbohydrate binding protein with CBM6 domain n=1 Tax=Leeuwenhoekiella polynyae TaxID=1550906 RepID=A0A4Q0P6G0_9FLAO|nr:glycoside hydrolase family 43 protein [Leeuwenhoekiella polynyae]RXG22220.1 carbohydrate binding protein with CBM6 domain [Leeuwenhoekiella polynyae]